MVLLKTSSFKKYLEEGLWVTGAELSDNVGSALKTSLKEDSSIEARLK